MEGKNRWGRVGAMMQIEENTETEGHTGRQQ